MAFFVKQFFLPYVKDELIGISFNEIKELINNQLSDLITEVIIKGKGNLVDFEKKVNNIFTKIDGIETLNNDDLLKKVREHLHNQKENQKKNKKKEIPQNTIYVSDNNIVIDYFLLQLLPQLKVLIPDANPKSNLEGTIINIINILLNHISNYPEDETYDNCIEPFSKFIISKSDIPNIAKCSILIKTIKNNTKTLDLPKKISDRITNFISKLKIIITSEDDSQINNFIEENKTLLMALDIKNTEMYNAIKVIVENIGNQPINIKLPDNINKYKNLIETVIKQINEPTVKKETLQPKITKLIEGITNHYFDDIKKTINSRIGNKYYLDNEDIYYEKYIKYKSKYLELKYQNENK